MYLFALQIRSNIFELCFAKKNSISFMFLLLGSLKKEKRDSSLLHARRHIRCEPEEPADRRSARGQHF